MLKYQNCMLCPRKCGVDRTKQTGFCGMPAQLRLAKAMLHFGEEPPISGTSGTGAVFFNGCTLRCSFCQNVKIQTGGKATEHLREIFENLIEQGAQSIDLVTPTHFLPDIIPALTPKLPVPVVYNCGGYESIETLKQLEGLVDVYMPDLKYSDNRLANALSKAPDYFEIATAAILEMYRQTGSCVMENGLLKRGVLIRHLVLPGNVDNTLGVIDWVAEHFPKREVLFSLMSQYVPAEGQKPPFDRRITEDEYAACVSWMQLCGIQNGFTQELSSATTKFLPDFNYDGIF